MFVVEREWTDFVVMGTGCTTTFCKRIHFSQEHWDTTFPKLESFFNYWIVPELAYPCVKYGLPKLRTFAPKSSYGEIFFISPLELVHKVLTAKMKKGLALAFFSFLVHSCA